MKHNEEYEEYYEPSAKRKKSRKKKFLIGFLVVVLFIIGFIGGSLFYVFGGLTTTRLPQDDKSLGISNTAPKESHIKNIALYGVDDRSNTDLGRSDAIIVLSVNTDSGKIKMLSVLRDSKVAVEGHGETKINHAYAYGGPELAIKTLNQNFNLDVKEFVTVNFSQLIDVIDAVNGIDVDLTQTEVKASNDLLQYQYPGSTPISGSGLVHLDGKQAVSFARIRKIDSDNARADRQKEVLSAVFNKVATMPKTDYPTFIHKFLAIVETSLDYGDLMDLSPVMLNGNLQLEQYTFPDANDNPWGGTDTDGVWYWKYDLSAAAKRMHSIIYDEATAAATDTTTDTTTNTDTTAQ